TATEYLSLVKNTGRLVELSDGCLEVLPMPTVFHQRIVRFLCNLLEAFVAARALGEVLTAPLPIQLWAGKFREPDLVFLRRGRVLDPHRQPEGADLALEVVSEGVENRERDLEVKRVEYAKAGIAEYWIVDPERRRIIVLSLDGPVYR